MKTPLGPRRSVSKRGPVPAVRVATVALAMVAVTALLGVTPTTASSPAPHGGASATSALWHAVAGAPAPSHAGHAQAIHASRYRTFSLDRNGMMAALGTAPMEFTAAAKTNPLMLALPAPRAGFQSFAVQESPIMEPGLARLHPDIRTYDGRGIDDQAATVRIAMTPIGFTASVRGQSGSWYIDSYYHLDQSLYVTYFGHDLKNTHGDFIEGQVRSFDRKQPWTRAIGASPALSTGATLKVYRLALLSDPSFATFWGLENVTAGKVILMNRANQIYGDEFAYRMDLVANNDRINLDTDALAFGTNGPCGSAACFTPSQLSSCGGSTLSRNRIVVGQLIGAENYDIGHVAVGQNGGGVAQLAVVGGDDKAEGCTGIPEPDGDFYVVDYMAHEMGHEFGMNHPFNGNQSNCGFGNRNPATSYEPGSGSSIMAYAGICGTDDLQPHSDPYFTAISYQETQAYTSSTLSKIDEVQTASFYDFGGNDSFRVRFRAVNYERITNGSNYTIAGIKEAIDDILPAGGTVTVAAFGGSGALTTAGFQVTFGGSLARSSVPRLALTDRTGLGGYVGITARGGRAPYNRGFGRIETGNHPPTSEVSKGPFTIPYQTPFALTGDGRDGDGDTVTYMWEQFDRGDAGGTGLVDNHKTNGPLFREFGTALDGDLYDPHAYGWTPCSNGENCVTTDPTRVFPDMVQVLANNTNAETGTCRNAGPPPVPPLIVDCYSEFLPTSVYAGPMHFILTTRDGNPNGGGVTESALVTVKLAPGTGPFLVTVPNNHDSYAGGSKLTVKWDVAGTDKAPIGTAAVDILLSTNGGKTFPITLASGAPNTGSAKITLPDKPTNKARIQIRAVGNIFFDVSDRNFVIT